MAERLDDLAKSWARDLRAADKADRTVVIYGQAVRFYADWLTAQDRPPTTESLTRHAIAAWLADLHTDHAAATVLTRFRGLRRFCRWAVLEELLEVNPMAGMEQPKPVDTPVPIITDAEIAALFKATAGKVFTDRRDHAILRILFDCGLRISECARLQLDDADMDADLLAVLGKGRRPRTVPFGAKTGRALDRYRRVRRAHPHAADPALWLTQRGALSTDGLDEILRRRGRQAGVENLHAHRFRHTFAHRWLADGGQERDLMRLAGWRSEAMLSRYGSSAADERAREAFKRMRLGDRL